MAAITFYSGDFSRTGGTERVTAQIASYLAGQGHEVTVLSHSGDGVPAFPCDGRIRTATLHMERHSGFAGRKIMPYVALRSYLATHRCDVFIAVDVLLAMYMLPLKPLFPQVKFVAWEHFNFHANNGVKNRDRARAMAGKRADAIVTLTKADKTAYEQNLHPRCPVVAIGNPIPVLQDELPDNRERLAIAVGRLTYQKHFDALIDIWSRIEPRHPDWRLAILGEGEDHPALETQIETLGLQHVRLAGLQDDMDAWYRRASVMLMTSRFEGLPMVLLEAQNWGLPIVSYDCVTGPAEVVIDGCDGYLVDEEDEDRFVERLDKMMSDDALRDEMSGNAMEDRKRFAMARIGNQWDELLASLTDRLA